MDWPARRVVAHNMKLILHARSLDRRVTHRTAHLPLKFGFVDADRAVEYLEFRGRDLPLEAVQRRLAAGERCLVARLDGRIVTAGWSASGEAPTAAIGRDLGIRQDDAWTYDWLTAAGLRGRALATARLCRELQELASAGRQRVFALAAPDSRSVFGPLDRTGFNAVGTVSQPTIVRRSMVRTGARRRAASLAPDHMRPPALGSRVRHATAARIRLAGRVAPQVMPRALWGAVPAREAYVERGDLWAVVVHHTGVPAAELDRPSAERAYARAIQRRHFARGWTDIGYHFIIAPSGRVFLGRPVEALAAHTLGHNHGTVGVAVAGDFERERPTAAALHALRDVLDRLSPDRHISVLGHGDLAATPCPGRFLHSCLGALSNDGHRRRAGDGYTAGTAVALG